LPGPSFNGTLLEIFVAGTTVEPKPSRHTVKAGTKVRLLLTTDKANVVHIHGVDIERNVKPATPLTLDFSIDQPGVYPIELHDPELLLTQLVVR
jgi:plastocyanin